FALDNRCPHMGFPLDRGSVEDGTLTSHGHHARFDLASGCTFDLWADDVPTCPAELRDGEVWVRPAFGYADPAAHWCQRLDDGLGHVLGLVIAKAVCGQLAARRTASGFRAAGRAVRDPESRRLGCRPDDPCCACHSPTCFARRGKCRSTRSLRSATTGRSCRASR